MEAKQNASVRSLLVTTLPKKLIVHAYITYCAQWRRSRMFVRPFSPGPTTPKKLIVLHTHTHIHTHSLFRPVEGGSSNGATINLWYINVFQVMTFSHQSPSVSTILFQILSLMSYLTTISHTLSIQYPQASLEAFLQVFVNEQPVPRGVVIFLGSLSAEILGCQDLSHAYVSAFLPLDFVVDIPCDEFISSCSSPCIDCGD